MKFSNTKPRSSSTRFFEKGVEIGLMASALVAVLATAGILWVLVHSALPFFREVPFKSFFFDTQWTPLFEDKHFGILPLLSGTLATTFIAMLVAVPVGLVIAVYLNLFAEPKERDVLKPLLEILGGVPTVVYGYFALLFVTPMLQKILPSLETFNVLAPGIVMGLMIVPYVSSLSEDALSSIPPSLREGAEGLGATRLQTAWTVLIPAARSGIIASLLLALSRAVGETMIVAVAAGMQPKIVLNPLGPAQTMTAYIVQVSLGDLPQGSLGYQTIFAVGLSLCTVTFFFNLLGHRIKSKMSSALVS